MKSFSNQENFYKRLRELSNVDAPSKSTSLDKQTLIEYSRATDGSALGIVKEDSSFYIKSSNTKGDIAVEHFTYIGGVENKLKYKFDSLAEATKKKNMFIHTLNESMNRPFNPAKTLREEKELLAVSNGDKGGIANAQSVADKNPKGETLKDTAKESEIAKPVSTDGIAKAQAEGDKNKSDDAASKLKQEHEASTATGKSREDIAKAQATANSVPKGEAIKTTAKESEVGKPVSTNGIAQAQSVADKNKSNEKGAATVNPKEVKPASDAKKEKAIVIENFGEENQEVAPEEPGAGSAIAPVDGDETQDLDAAASALDALDIKADSEVGNENPMGGGAEQSAEVPAGNGAESPIGGADASMGGGADDGALKDLEKLVGKTGQKIRSTELSDEMVTGFLKSLISSFDGKLADMDSDVRRELANKILKAGEEGEESNGAPASAAPISAPTSDSENSPSAEPGAENNGPEKEVDESGEGMIPEDHEIEAAINQHLAEMGMAEQGGVAGGAPAMDKEPAMGASQHPNSFKNYMSERGYENEDISVMEAISLVSSYANECDGDTSKADMQSIAEFMSPEVKQGVSECGYGRFAESFNMFSVKPKKYKSVEPVVEIHEEEVTEEAVAEEAKVDEKKEFNFAPAGESLNKKEKEEKKEDEPKKEDVSESAKTKLQAIINVKIQEQLGLRKSSVNEGSKSSFSKKLDEMIAAEIKKGRIALKAKRTTLRK